MPTGYWQLVTVKLILGLVCAAAMMGGDSIDVAVTARSVQPGELVVLTLTMPVPVERVRVHAFDRAAAVYRDGERSWRALIGIDLDVTTGVHAVTIASGQATTANFTMSLP